MVAELPAGRWNYSTAAHLLNRAGFGGSPAQIEALARLKLTDAVERLISFPALPPGPSAPAWAKPDPDRVEHLRTYRKAGEEERKRLQKERNQRHREQLLELQHWWLHRMVSGEHPLQEKLTLFWHGHFATSVQKVKDPYLMWRQNDLFRRLGGGGWEPLLAAVTRDPAMLIWLDQAQSKPDHPNENYAREFLELFTLGEGNYSERDVTELARALTGLTLDRDKLEPAERRRLRAAGPKTILGQTGKWTTDEVLQFIANHPQSARFITAKLWTFFAGAAPDSTLQAALAAEFRRQRGEFRPLLRTLFLSEAFYAPPLQRQQIKSPVQLLVQACRQLERRLPPPLLCVQIQRNLGQELFNPPNVKGWDGGAAWINTNTLLNRHNLALLLVTGQNSLPALARKASQPQQPRPAKRLQRLTRSGATEVARLFAPEARHDPDLILAELERRLINGTYSERSRHSLRNYLAAQDRLEARELQGVLRLAMCTPEYQLT
jgi:uncharacterized protein (DUF1800 family)